LAAKRHWWKNEYDKKLLDIGSYIHVVPFGECHNHKYLLHILIFQHTHLKKLDICSSGSEWERKSFYVMFLWINKQSIRLCS
jgi:hypothetical protein